jgi:tetratricopeptide (TPR) repeat protein
MVWAIVFAWCASAASSFGEPILSSTESPRLQVHEFTKGPQRIDEIERAIKSFRQQRYDEALSLLQAAKKKRADLPPARLLLAELFFASNQAQLGRAVLEQAAAETPKHPGVYILCANLAQSEGRRTDALVLFEKAEALAGDKQWVEGQRRYYLIQCRSGRAAVAEVRKDWPAVGQACSAWLELEPKSGPVRERLARALFFQGKQEEALAALKQAYKDDPTLKTPLVNLGLLFVEKGDNEKAVQAMQAAVKEQPGDWRAHAELALCRLNQGRIYEAKASAKTAEGLNAGARETKFLRGLLALASANYPEAEREYQDILREAPEDSLARDKLALALVEQSSEIKQRRALELAMMNIRLYPSATWPLSTAGWVYYRLGRVDEAERALRAAVSGPSAQPNAAYYLGRMLSEQGRNDEAKKLLELALRSPAGELTFRREAEKCLAQLTKTGPE